MQEVLQKQKEDNIPQYCKKEEYFNAISHMVGGGLGILFFLISLPPMIQSSGANKWVAMSIYCFSLVALYTMSTLYHILPPGKAKQIFRIFDHCTIFVLIAGCYTPFCLIPLWGTPLGWTVFGIEWGIAVLGITFNAINMHWKAVKILSMIGYVLMGWMIAPMVGVLLPLVPPTCFGWLLAGGIAYTLGIIFYAIGNKKASMHCIWHLFVLLGSILQFVSIYQLL
ncbi:MAG: hemolysin III family protein [Clostridia bacterium]|nr:hemolysin III family protein [Clostridia bacterium]